MDAARCKKLKMACYPPRSMRAQFRARSFEGVCLLSMLLATLCKTLQQSGHSAIHLMRAIMLTQHFHTKVTVLFNINLAPPNQTYPVRGRTNILFVIIFPPTSTLRYLLFNFLLRKNRENFPNLIKLQL